MQCFSLRDTKTSKTALLVGASSLLLAGIFGPKLMRFEAEDNEGQKVFYISGAPVVLADGGTVRVMMGPSDSVPEKNQRIIFYLRVQNFSQQPITISEDQIKAARIDGQEIRILASAEVRRDIAKRADRKRFAANLAGALGAFADGYSGESGNINSAEKQRQIQEQILRADNQEALENAMAPLYLSRETLFPGQYFFGFVVIDPPDAKGKETTFQFLTIFAGDPIPLEFKYLPAQ
jgi:hypothetical protein